MLWTALATAPAVLGTFEIKALIIRSSPFRPSTIAIGGTVSGACGHRSPQPLVVPYPDPYMTQTEQSSMQGGDQPDRRRMAFLGSQALLVAGQRPFRRPGRFVLGLLDVLAMRWRCGFLRRPRPPKRPLPCDEERLGPEERQAATIWLVAAL